MKFKCSKSSICEKPCYHGSEHEYNMLCDYAPNCGSEAVECIPICPKHSSKHSSKRYPKFTYSDVVKKISSGRKASILLIAVSPEEEYTYIVLFDDVKGLNINLYDLIEACEEKELDFSSRQEVSIGETVIINDDVLFYGGIKGTISDYSEVTDLYRINIPEEYHKIFLQENQFKVKRG